MSTLVLIIIVLIIAFFLLRASILVVPQQRAWVVERLGRYSKVLGPGLNIIVPFIDRVSYRFDMRELPLEVPAQVCISLDNTTMTVDGVLYMQITDAVKAAYGSSNPFLAVTQLAQTTMRSEIGKLHLDQALSSRQLLNAAVASAVDEAALNWGVKVLRYEIKDITPPGEIIRAMELQITAEREKRAIIAKSEGLRQQQINTSEGQRQQEINLADGRKQAEILRAEGEAQAIRLVAEATAQAIGIIGKAAREPGGMEALQMQLAKDYIDKWGNLAKAGTSLVIPADLGNVGALVSTALAIVQKQGQQVSPSTGSQS
ncbi:MAG: SPFH/Band 7/PHB domain protein [Acidithiobacillus sp.]|nr:SPFH/Band 7/PHB domain protein [Acidithiobacillus sp.]